MKSSKLELTAFLDVLTILLLVLTQNDHVQDQSQQEQVELQVAEASAQLAQLQSDLASERTRADQAASDAQQANEQAQRAAQEQQAAEQRAAQAQAQAQQAASDAARSEQERESALQTANLGEQIDRLPGQHRAELASAMLNEVTVVMLTIRESQLIDYVHLGNDVVTFNRPLRLIDAVSRAPTSGVEAQPQTVEFQAVPNLLQSIRDQLGPTLLPIGSDEVIIHIIVDTEGTATCAALQALNDAYRDTDIHLVLPAAMSQCPASASRSPNR